MCVNVDHHDEVRTTRSFVKCVRRARGLPYQAVLRHENEKSIERKTLAEIVRATVRERRTRSAIHGVNEEVREQHRLPHEGHHVLRQPREHFPALSLSLVSPEQR